MPDLANELDVDPIQEIRLQHAGMSASILTCGAAIRDLIVPLRHGTRRVVLGFEGPESYRGNPANLGVVVGRCANRIADGRFVLDGREYRLPLNEKGRTHLHGGKPGFGHRPWRLMESGAAHVLFGIGSPDGDQGYPGRVDATCRYTLTEAATLRVELLARTTAPSPVNLAQHSYFTLAESGDSRDLLLTIDADGYTPTDERLIPTGAIAPVAGTPYDFRAPRPIGEAGQRYDINMVLRGGRGPLERAARVVSPGRDLAMELWTTEPGLQLYDSANLGPGAPGIDGQRHFPHAGLCLEPQRFPDSVNHAHFSPVVLRPGEEYHQVTEYRFSVPD